MQLSKTELLSFFEFLSERDITIVPYTRTYYSLFNGRHTIDCTEEVRTLAELVKTHSPEECYRLGPRYLGRHELNCNHRLMPELSYREDLEEYLAGLIEDEEQRGFYSRLIDRQHYKKYRHDRPRPAEFTEDFDLWAKAYRPLPGRLSWAVHFPYDFEFWLDKYHHHHLPERLVLANRTPLTDGVPGRSSENGAPTDYVLRLR